MKTILLALGLTACATMSASDQVRILASHELHCDESQVKANEVNPHTVQVNACGRDETYVEQCATAGTDHCTWVAQAGGAPVR